MYNVAMMFQHGRGTGESSQEAAKWFRKVRVQTGHAAAVLLFSKPLTFILASLTRDGLPGRKSFRAICGASEVPVVLRRLAIDQRRVTHASPAQAAETGMAPAQYSLSLCYRKGSGVPKSEEWADVWFKKVVVMRVFVVVVVVVVVVGGGGGGGGCCVVVLQTNNIAPITARACADHHCQRAIP
jgi:hypothetical protein